MVTSKARRKAFLAALHELLSSRGFDGVDYNWEYPTNEKEWKGLVRLMKESRGEVSQSRASRRFPGGIRALLSADRTTSPLEPPVLINLALAIYPADPLFVSN